MIAIAVGLVVLLTGCVAAFFSEPTPVPAGFEVVGTWVHDGAPEGWFTSEAPGGEMRFFADHRFELDNVPDSILRADGVSQGAISATGEWKSPRACAEESVCSFLLFDEPFPIGGNTLYFSGSGDSVTVYFVFGRDAEKQYRFHRKA